MAILFLDVDGVICVGRNPAPILLDRLARVQRASGCLLVLSSVKRHSRSSRQAELHESLRTVGLQLHSHIGDWGMRSEPAWLTAEMRRTDWCRTFEIQAWRAQHGLHEAYAAVDDSGLCLPSPHFVKTDFFTCLTDELAERLIEALRAPVTPVNGVQVDRVTLEGQVFDVFSDGRSMWATLGK